MLRWLAVLLLPLALAAACSSNGDSGTTPAQDQDSSPGTTTEASSSDGVSSAVLDTINPFDLLGGLGNASFGEADPDLQAALLEPGDLPGDFLPLGDFSFSSPSEFGDIDLVANMFMSGDIVSGSFDAMVMSFVMSLPPEALEEFGGDFSALSGLDSDIEDTFGDIAGESGVPISEVRLLDASGLGEGGFGMHMEMGSGDLLGGLGGAAGNPFAGGIAMDMFAFGEGDRMMMLMVMWPAGQSSGVDARDLAGRMR